jgi:integrase
MKAIKLTKRTIDELMYDGDGASRDVRWDASLPGFGIRVYPSGKKAFVLSYREAGRKRLMTLGAYGPLTLDQARDQATLNLGEIIKGHNPLDQRKDRARAKTIGDLCSEYLTRYAPSKKSYRDDQRYIEKYILARWRGIRIDSLKRSDIADLHHSFASRAPYAGNRLLALLRRMLNLAKLWGFVGDGFSNAATGIPLHKEFQRDRWVTADELPRLADAISKHSNPYVRGALWLYLLTGVRKSELLGAKWADIDLDRRELRLSETKAGRPHVVPLSEPALEVLRSLPRDQGNPYVLPGRKGGEHLVNIAKPWDKVRCAAGIEDVRLHDLRRTVGSWLAQSGNDIHLIGKILNHSNLSTSMIYARFEKSVERQALEQHGAQIIKAAKMGDGRRGL